MYRKLRDISGIELNNAVGNMMEKLNCAGSIAGKYSVYCAVMREWDKSKK